MGEKLGEGLEGQVRLGEDKLTQELVALKIVDHKPQDEQF